MNDDPLDAMIRGGTALLDIPLDPAWHEAVRAHLAVCLRMGTEVAAFPLPDAAEPAPVFTP
jgi:hypothetical protein